MTTTCPTGRFDAEHVTIRRACLDNPVCVEQQAVARLKRLRRDHRAGFHEGPRAESVCR